jgi:hypothetical protein
MKKAILKFLFCICLVAISERSLAWGKTGHELVAQIAFQLLDEPTKQIVKGYLGNLSIEEAANWMDEERSNSYYNFMRTWHYLDIDKGEEFKPSTERNVLTVLHSAITELRQYKILNKKDIKRDLLLIFHLVGDLHQPLHTGYSIDKGGNTIEVTSPVVSGNLHSVWDTQILEYKGINLDTCMKFLHTLTTQDIGNYKKINELKWMYQSRSLLDTVYNFQNNFLDKNYVDNNAQMIKKQLVIAGIRLSAILSEVFAVKPNNETL